MALYIDDLLENPQYEVGLGRESDDLTAGIEETGAETWGSWRHVNLENILAKSMWRLMEKLPILLNKHLKTFKTPWCETSEQTRKFKRMTRTHSSSGKVSWVQVF